MNVIPVKALLTAVADLGVQGMHVPKIYFLKILMHASANNTLALPWEILDPPLHGSKSF